jgi:transcriptional regulator with XRE-family HTH domain
MTGTELADLRKRAGFKAYEFAGMLGVGVATLSRYERDHKRIPKTVEYAARWLVAEDSPGQRLVNALREALEPSGA